MITYHISKKILTIGEQYKNHRGGIAGVINNYSSYFECFNFISTYKPTKNKLVIIITFSGAIFSLFKKLSSDKEIEILHLHGAAKGSFFRKYIVFIIGKFLFGKKIIYHIHGSEYKDFYNNSNYVVRKIISVFINKADLLICLSETWKTFFLENFKNKNVVILENIIERPSMVDVESSANLVIKILFLGYVGKRKGIFDLLEVISEHKEYLEGKVQLIIGGNGETEILTNLIKSNRLENIVRYKGWVNKLEKAALLSESDIYILPSYNEGLPLSILEALSYRLPVISTPVGGIPEIIFDSINGFLVKPGDKTAMFDRLARFIDNPALIREMGERSGEIILPYFAEAVVPKLNSIYQNLLKDI